VEVNSDVAGIIHDWPNYLTAALLVLVRFSGLMVFAPIFNSSAISPRIKAGFAVALTLLLAPVVTALRGARPILDANAILGELGVGLVFGLSLTLLSEALAFAGMLLGIEFSFSLVNLLDPNTLVETPVLAQLLNWFGVLVLLGSGLYRSVLMALMRSFATVPVGQAVVQANTGKALAAMVSGVFLAGLQLAAPVMAAALTVEITMALVGRLSPQLPAMIVSIPLKTLTSYVVLIASLAVWPGWIERHFTMLLDAATRLVVRA
jgi:flagellar biosynthetic protein FliR